MKPWRDYLGGLTAFAIIGAALYGASAFVQWISDWGTTTTILFLGLVVIVAVLIFIGDEIGSVSRTFANLLKAAEAGSAKIGRELDALRSALVSKDADSPVQEVVNISGTLTKMVKVQEAQCLALANLVKVAEEQTLCLGAIEHLLEPRALSSLEQIGWDRFAGLRKKMDEMVAQAAKQDRRWILMRDGAGRCRRVYWGEISGAREKGWTDA